MLKILKGNPPPVSNIYSAELRNLIQVILNKSDAQFGQINQNALFVWFLGFVHFLFVNLCFEQTIYKPWKSNEQSAVLIRFNWKKYVCVTLIQNNF